MKEKVKNLKEKVLAKVEKHLKNDLSLMDLQMALGIINTVETSTNDYGSKLLESMDLLMCNLKNKIEKEQLK